LPDRAAGIIIHKRHILLIQRFKDGQDYYVFPGGGVETGETEEEACAREVREETGLELAWIGKGFDHTTSRRPRKPEVLRVHYFFVEPLPGDLILSGPELLKRSEQNRYLPQWVPLARLGEVELRPAEVQAALVQVIREAGLPQSAQDLARSIPRMVEILGPYPVNGKQ
jgi:8-oxo-dGTP pyrophosphatase MutT (NUDIX family)